MAQQCAFGPMSATGNYVKGARCESDALPDRRYCQVHFAERMAGITPEGDGKVRRWSGVARGSQVGMKWRKITR